MKNKKKNLGQFFTTNSKYIVGNLLEVLPNHAIVVDPFAGNWDLLNIISDDFKKLGYDIDPKNDQTVKQNTLLNPPDYTEKWILTNPPYLARNQNNKSTNKGSAYKAINAGLYEKYEVNDLYKVSMLTLEGCEGGILIVPLNFFCEESAAVRKKFFSLFRILKLNIFEEQVFDNTSYTVCAFSFIKENNILKQNIETTFFPSKVKKQLLIEEEFGFRLGGEFYSFLGNNQKYKISRMTKGDDFKSHLKLRAIDTGSVGGEIKLEYTQIPYLDETPNKTERTFCSFKFENSITEKEEMVLIEKFNSLLDQYRKEYHSLFLTNFRNSTDYCARKRISFDLAYQIISKIIEDNPDCFPSFH